MYVIAVSVWSLIFSLFFQYVIVRDSVLDGHEKEKGGSQQFPATQFHSRKNHKVSFSPMAFKNKIKNKKKEGTREEREREKEKKKRAPF